MDFAKTLKEYSEKLDDLLIQKFHKWEDADWKNSLGMTYFELAIYS